MGLCPRWGKADREDLELREFTSGGPHYPGMGSANGKRALLDGGKHHTCTARLWRGIVRMRRQKWFAFLIMGALNIALLISGAYAMRSFEASAEAERNAAYNQLVKEMTAFYSNCSKPPYSAVWNASNCRNLSRIHAYYHRQEAALSVYGDVGNSTKWTVAGSLQYTASVMTTIGYGYLFPVTRGGKMFTIAFACIAIPITWGWMGFIGNMWIDACRWLNRQTFVRCGIKSRAKQGPKQRYTVLWMFLVLSGYVCGMAAVYKGLPHDDEPRSKQPQGFIEYVYFSFITLSTIGFGHYYVGDTSIGDTALQLFTMFTGIAILSGFIAIMWQTISKILVKADYIIVHELDLEDDDGMLLLYTAGENGSGRQNGIRRTAVPVYE